tara:strand:- start:116 stop:562 length:447 start_codon:yes stop_codon:yes gene_type:complete
MNFKIHKNILTKKEQKNLLNFVKKKVQYLGEDYPGLQTKGDLHTYKELCPFLKKINKYVQPNKIFMCWGNYTDGSFISWHNHEGLKYSMVYYLKSPQKLGVMFTTGKYGVIYTKGLENSLAIFDGSKVHSMPNSYKKMNRYTIAVDII